MNKLLIATGSFLLIITVVANNTDSRIIEIFNSGEGKTPQIAHKVYKKHKEYLLCRFMKLNPKKMLMVTDDQYVDVLQAG